MYKDVYFNVGNNYARENKCSSDLNSYSPPMEYSEATWNNRIQERVGPNVQKNMVQKYQRINIILLMVAYTGDGAKGGGMIYFYFVHFCKLITFLQVFKDLLQVSLS